MRKPIYLPIVILIFLGFFSGFHGQQTLPQKEEYEVEVRLVLVDVIVTKDGKFVTDLTQEDFEIYEDGKRVTINSFELISFEEGLIEIPTERPEKAPPGIPKKQLVVVFDGVSSWQRNLKEGSRKIVDEFVSLTKLGHEVMIIQLREDKGIEVIQSFTTDEKLVRKALVLASGHIWYDRSQDALKMWQELGIDATGDMTPVDRYGEQVQPMLEQEYLFVERGRFEKAIGGVLAVANMIKDLPGRKTILLISDGFPDITQKSLDSIITESTPERTVSGARTPHLDIRRDSGKIRVFDPFNLLDKKKIMSGEEVLRELIRFANAQNISIYALDPATFTKYFISATAEFGPRDSAVKSLESRTQDKIARVQNLRWLSEDTGGVTLRGASKYDEFYDVMRTDLNDYYQLSYYPPRENPDNNYHKIDVKVNRSGIDMRHRKGYTDYSDVEQEKLLLVSAFYNPSLFSQVPFEAEFVPFVTESEKFIPWMHIGLPTQKLFIEKGVTFGSKKFDLHVWVKEKEMGGAAFRGQIHIPFVIDESFMNLIKSTDFLLFHYSGREVEFKQKDYQAIFALYDGQTNEVGTWEESFSIPDFKKDKQGAIIDCVLGSVTPNPKKGKKSFNFDKDGGLEYGEIRFYPAVNNRFPRMQNASLFLQAYLPQGKIKANPQFSILIRKGLAQPVPAEKVVETWDKKSKTWSVLFNLDLMNVFPGDYKLKIGVPLSEKGPVLQKEVKISKLRY